MIFDSCQDQLAQAAELHDAGLLDEKMLTDMKSKAVARYQSSLDDRATQKLSQSTVSGGGVSEDDEEEPPSKRSRQQRSDTPASGRNSSSGSRKTGVQQRRVFSRQPKAPEKGTLDDNAKWLANFCGQSSHKLWYRDEDGADHEVSVSNTVNAEQACNGAAFDVWVPALNQPLEGTITDYVCSVCAEASGDSLSCVPRVSVVDKVHALPHVDCLHSASMSAVVHACPMSCMNVRCLQPA